MDKQNGTLNALLETLSLKSNLLGWNMYQNKSGVIMVKIRFSEHNINKDNNEKSHGVQSEEYFSKGGKRNRSESQINRNFMRAEAWKEKHGSKRKRHGSSPELPRNGSFSETIPDPIPDITRCEVDSECFASASDHGDTPESPMTAQKPLSTDPDISYSDNQPCIQNKTHSKYHHSTPDIEFIDQRDHSDCDFEDRKSISSANSVESETPRWMRADPKCWARRCIYDNDNGSLVVKTYHRNQAEGKPTIVDLVKHYQYGRSLRWCEKCEDTGQPFLMCRKCHEVHKRHDRHKDFIRIPIGCQTKFWDEEELDYYCNLAYQ